jgi:nucleoside-diphosphate-sugar epimerase
VLSIFIKNLLKNKPLKVFGSGFQERDFIDVHSVVEALALGICINGTYNVSTGKSTSINDLIYVISKFLPVNQVDYLPAIPGELKYNCLDNQLLQSHGWRPILSLEEGIEKTIKWFKEHLNEESVP